MDLLETWAREALDTGGALFSEDLSELRGAKIDAMQAAPLARYLGIEVI